MFKEPYIDYRLQRPYTIIEEMFFLKFQKYDRLNPIFVFSRRLGMFWPEWIVWCMINRFVKFGYITPLRNWSDIYVLTGAGKEMLTRLVSYSNTNLQKGGLTLVKTDIG